MKKTDQKLTALFQAAKKVNPSGQTDASIPYGFATRVVARYFVTETISQGTGVWDVWVLRGAFGALVLSGFLLWMMRGNLEVYSDEYIEARVIETNVYEDLL